MHNTPTTKKKGWLIASIIGVSIALQFLLPGGVALADTPRPGNDVCAVRGNFNIVCYPDRNACLVGEGFTGGTCVEAFSTKTKWQVFKEFINPANVVKDMGAVAGAKLESAAMSVLVWLASFVFKVAGYFLDSMGDILDFAIGRTIDSRTYSNMEAVNVGWTTVRDFSNLFFIFALLYIAIKTILGMGGANTKRWVANLIIAALLINFSLFATKVVIDAGNVLAMGFWEKMVVSAPTPANPNATAESASMQFLKGFRMQTTVDVSNMVDPTTKVPYTQTNQLLIYLGGAAVMFIGGYVFLVGAVMMIVRTVTLLFLLIVSPFAFLGFALPVSGGWAKVWLSKLIGSTFVAPAFLAVLYLDTIIVNSLDISRLTGGTNSSMAAAFTGLASNFSIIYNYVLLIILFLAALKVADSVSSGASGVAKGYLQKAKRYAQNTAGVTYRAGAATTGFALRQTMGRANKRELDRLQSDKAFQDKLKLQTPAGIEARAKLARTEKLAGSTYDVRNTKVGGAVHGVAGLAGVNTGTGNKRNMLEDDSVMGFGGDKADKKTIDDAKRMFPGNDVAQARYIKERMGDRLNHPKYKTTKDVADKVINADENKKSAKKQLIEHKAQTALLEKHNKDKEDIEKAGGVADAALIKAINDTAAAVEAASVGIKSSMQKMSSAEKAEFADDHADNVQFTNNLNKADLFAIQRKALSDKGYKPGTTEKLTKNIAAGDNMANISYMSSAAGKDALFELGDIEEHDLSNYERNKDRIVNARAAEAAVARRKDAADAAVSLASAKTSGDMAKISDAQRDAAAAKSRTYSSTKAEEEAYSMSNHPLFTSHSADLAAAKIATKEAQSKLSEAQANGLPSWIADQQKELAAAKLSEKSAQDKLDKLAN